MAQIFFINWNFSPAHTWRWFKKDLWQIFKFFFCIDQWTNERIGRRCFKYFCWIKGQYKIKMTWQGGVNGRYTVTVNVWPLLRRRLIVLDDGCGGHHIVIIYQGYARPTDPSEWGTAAGRRAASRCPAAARPAAAPTPPSARSPRPLSALPLPRPRRLGGGSRRWSRCLAGRGRCLPTPTPWKMNLLVTRVCTHRVPQKIPIRAARG